jgi:hypothetical protein
VDLLAPFTGTLLLPDHGFVDPTTPVQLADGRTVAGIGWHYWADRFDVLDGAGTVIAECRPRGVFRVQYEVITTDGRPVVDVVMGGWRAFDGALVTLAGGRQLSLSRPSASTRRRFEVHGTTGLAGRIEPTTNMWIGRFSSYAFEIFGGALSVLEAVSVAQAIRTQVRRRRRTR